MEKHLNELDNLDRELSSLRNKLEKSFEVIEDLAQIQKKFGELSETYGQFLQYKEEARTILRDMSQAKERFYQRFSDLEKEIEGRYGDFNTEMLNIQDEAKTILGEITQAEEKFIQSFAEIKTLKTDLRTTLNQLKESGINPMHFKKMDKLNNQIDGLMSYLNIINRKLQTMGIWLFLSFAAAFLALSMPLLQVIFKGLFGAG
jgi:chromosome segregation ATPase